MPIRCAVVGATMLYGALVTGTAGAQRITPAVSALGQVEPGLWEVRSKDAPTRNLCVIDPAALTQVRHAGAACARLVIADAGANATVHYSCPGAGWGRTSVHASSPTSVRIDTQGIADHAPFAFTAQARRTGACGGAVRTSFVR